jgi:hypothetical protein
LEDFSGGNITRKDVENLVKNLITGKNSSKNLSSTYTNQWVPNKFNG